MKNLTYLIGVHGVDVDVDVDVAPPPLGRGGE